MSVPTPHISAQKEDIAKTVIMPGDPLRSKFIAETYLDAPVLVNDVRGVQGYTGTYKGARVTVMASGMGIPSMGIYSYELYNFYDVANIIRVGTAGGISDDIKLRDVIAGMSASTNSAFADQFHLPGRIAPTASYELLRLADDTAASLGINLRVGGLVTNDTFYDTDPETAQHWKRMGLLAIEMESAGLYLTAARAGTRALAICTISDMILTGEQCTPEERQTSFTDMITIALNMAHQLDSM